MVLNSLTYPSKKNGGKLGTDPQRRLTHRGGWCQDRGQAGVMSLMPCLVDSHRMLSERREQAHRRASREYSSGDT